MKLTTAEVRAMDDHVFARVFDEEIRVRKTHLTHGGHAGRLNDLLDARDRAAASDAERELGA